MKLSDYMIDFLAQNGVSRIFEVAGGAITHLLDSTYDRTDIECVSMHHEQGASFAAEGYARVRGLGVAMATSGPGALNMMTGIGSCYFDSVPCLFITGQVNTYEYKFDRPQRQIGFQETDIVSVARPLTKYARLVTDPSRIRYELEKAVYLAQSGRPGPVLLDLPMNVQRADIDPDALEAFDPDMEQPAADDRHVDSSAQMHDNAMQQVTPAVLDRVLEMMAAASRPIVLAGGGVRAAGAQEELAALVQHTRIPVVASLMGLDALPQDNPAFCGMIGTYGNRYANLALANADFLLVVGSRLDTRQTGTLPESFARAALKVHIDADPAELGAKVQADLAILADAKDFLRQLNGRLAGRATGDLSAWYGIISGYRDKYGAKSSPVAPATEAGAPPEAAEESNGGSARIDPNEFMELLSRHSRGCDTICLDVGQNQMWAAQSFRVHQGQRMLVAGGMAAMGFALPAAIGAAEAVPGSRAIAISGDGGLQMNIQELDTLARRGLPVKIVVMNNGCLGMVRQFQDMYFEGRRQSTVRGYSCPDLAAIARAYGLPVATIGSAGEADKLLPQMLAAPGPALIDVRLEMGSDVNPKLTVNKPIEDQSPYLPREELAQNMQIGLMEEEKLTEK